MGKPSVLVVEYDRAIIAFLEMALGGEGYLVLPAVGAAALRAASQHLPRVILLDMGSPDMDAVVLVQRLRADPATRRIPIVAMSPRTRQRPFWQLLPVDDTLPDPFDLCRLYDTVERWMLPHVAHAGPSASTHQHPLP